MSIPLFPAAFLISTPLQFKRAGALGGWLLAVLALASLAGAAESGRTVTFSDQDPITAKVSIGLDPDWPYRRDYSWVPLTVELTNRRDDFTGRLLVRLKQGTVTYSTPIDLPANTKKSYSLMVYVPELLDELEFYVATPRREIPVQVVTVSTAYQTTNRFIAVISPERGSHDHFAHRTEEENVELFRRVLYTTPAHLPQNIFGYQNVDVVIWDGGPVAALAPGQVKALEDWIQAGGSLVLAAGQYWQELNASPFRLYIPMTLTGSLALDSGTALDAPGENATPVLSAGTVIATGELLPDPQIRVRLRAGEHPFLVERPWGAGRVVFCAARIDTPLFQDPAHEFIFKEYLCEGPLAFNSKVPGLLDQDILGFLRWMIQAELPSTWFIAVYLGIYILLVVPVNYLVFRMIGRLEWAWFTVPIWAVVFAYGAYYIGALRQQGSVAVNEISVVEARPSSAVGTATTYCSIYSPVRKWYTIRFDDPAAYPQLPDVDRARSGGPAADETLSIQYLDGATLVEDYLIYHWSQRLLKAQHEVSLGEGVDVNLRWENNNRLSGSITNRTGMTLVNPTLHTLNAEYQFESLAGGATLTLDENWAAHPLPDDRGLRMMRMPRAPFSNYQQYERDPARFIQENLKYQYGRCFFEENPSAGQVLLTARLEMPPLRFRMNGVPVSPRGETLLCVVLPLRKPLQGRLILDPNAWRYVSSALPVFGGGYGFAPPRGGPIPRGMPYGGGPFPGNGIMQLQGSNNQEIVWDLTTEIPLTGGKIESLKIEARYGDMGFPFAPSAAPSAAPFELVKGKPASWEYELFLQNLYEVKYDPLSAIADGDGYLINPGRYVDKISSVMAMKLKAPPNRTIQINPANLLVELSINFGTESGGVFLGRYVDAVEEKPKPYSSGAE
ncbi:MAG: hypothetical protein ACE15F_14045 [bacterium]